MNSIYAKLNKKSSLSSEPYRKILNIDDPVYEDVLGNDGFEFEEFIPTRIPEDNLWFYIENFSNTNYADKLIKDNLESSELDNLKKDDYKNVELLIVKSDDLLSYQRMTPSKLIAKKGLFYFGDAFNFYPEVTTLQLNSYPDAIYSKAEDRLYFRNFDSTSNIFANIYELYEEATDEDVQTFLNNKFITCIDGFNFKLVKKRNRKKLTQVIKKLNEFSSKQIDGLLDYLEPYCQEIYVKKHLFRISSDNEFGTLLNGFCENYYTKPISNEKTLAHSTSKIS